jgi:peptide/nickel transport system substrate-binding protein
MTGLRAAWLGAASLGILAGAASAQQHLTMAVGAPITSLDPHYHQLSPNNAVADMIFDTLTDTDAAARLRPALAESYRPISENVWEFKLRPGVRFHNGNPLTAEDVAFTFERVPNVPNSPSSFAVYSRPLTRVEIVDPLTIRIRTDGPYPLMPVDMANLRILAKETHEGATTARFNSGELAVGTGPWRVVSYRSGDRIEFVRNDAYWGQKPAFERVTYRMITNDATRTASLLAGDVDVIDQVPTADLAKLRTDPRVTLSERVGLRIVNLWVDHANTGPSPFVVDNNGQPIAQNPLKDVRVRRALALAVDRDSLGPRLFGSSAAAPVPALSPPAGSASAGGGADWAGEPLAERQAEARRLLAEAGVALPLRLQVAVTTAPEEETLLAAVAADLAAVGIDLSLARRRPEAHAAAVAKGEFALALVSRETPYGSPLPFLLPFRCAANRHAVCVPEADRLMAEAWQAPTAAARLSAYAAAERLWADDVAAIGLVQPLSWALVSPRLDGFSPNAAGVHPIAALSIVAPRRLRP